MALISNFEIIQKSVAGKEYPMDKLDRFKDIVESHYMRNCFGKTFYNELKDSVNDWSEINEWTSSGTYNTDSIVSWNGEVMKSTIDSNTSEPSLTSTDWIKADKFDTTEYDTLWKTYLGQIIANKIILECVVPDTYRVNAKGLMKATEDSSNSIALDKSEMGLWFSNVQKFIDMAEDEMKAYMQSQYDLYKANPSTGFNYSSVQFIGDCETCSTSSNNVKRRIGFDD
jgi:hypothetical protein